MRVRIALAWKANIRLKCIWKCHYIERGLKIRLFTSVVQAVLLYGAETWSPTKSMDRSIDGAYTKLLRYALDVSWRDHAFNGGNVFEVADEGSGDVLSKSPVVHDMVAA